MSSYTTTSRDLKDTLKALLAGEGRGILAADESLGTIGKRFQSVGLNNSEALRQRWRELLFNTDGLEQYISGVILHEETLLQLGSDGRRLPAALESRGIVVGIKLDAGTTPMHADSIETVTEGLDFLAERCRHYKRHGARFAKWRATFRIVVAGQTAHDPIKLIQPSEEALRRNAKQLAMYASMCQKCGLVPIVEPEVLTLPSPFHNRSSGHSIEVCAAATTKYMLLKPNMILPSDPPPPPPLGAGSSQVALATLSVLQQSVPKHIPAIVFLSGGQTEEAAAHHLMLMQQYRSRYAGQWQLSFSYGRALQSSALGVWAKRLLGGVSPSCTADADGSLPTEEGATSKSESGDDGNALRCVDRLNTVLRGLDMGCAREAATEAQQQFLRVVQRASLAARGRES